MSRHYAQATQAHCEDFGGGVRVAVARVLMFYSVRCCINAGWVDISRRCNATLSQFKKRCVSSQFARVRRTRMHIFQVFTIAPRSDDQHENSLASRVWELRRRELCEERGVGGVEEGGRWGLVIHIGLKSDTSQTQVRRLSYV